MGKTQESDGAKWVKPTHAVEGVAEMESNRTTIFAPVNEMTMGQDLTPQQVGSLEDVVKTFKPKMECDIDKISNIADPDSKKSSVTITVEYGANDPTRVIKDFDPESVVVNAATSEHEKILLDQQLQIHAIEDLQQKLGDRRVAEWLEKNRDAVIKAIEEQIKHMEEFERKSGLKDSAGM